MRVVIFIATLAVSLKFESVDQFIGSYGRGARAESPFSRHILSATQQLTPTGGKFQFSTSDGVNIALTGATEWGGDLPYVRMLDSDRASVYFETVRNTDDYIQHVAVNAASPLESTLVYELFDIVSRHYVNAVDVRSATGSSSALYLLDEMPTQFARASSGYVALYQDTLTLVGYDDELGTVFRRKNRHRFVSSR